MLFTVECDGTLLLSTKLMHLILRFNEANLFNDIIVMNILDELYTQVKEQM